MEFKQILLSDLKEAMKNKDIVTKDCIQFLRSEILKKEKDTQKEVTDEDIYQIIQKEIKQKKDVLVDFEKANRTDLITKTEREIQILELYLPEQMSYEDLLAECEHQYQMCGFKKNEVCPFIKYMRDCLGATANSSDIAKAVKEVLNQVEE